MTGVEILAIEEVAVNFGFNWTAFLIVACVIIAIFILVGIIMSIDDADWCWLAAGCLCGILMASLIGSLAGIIEGTPIEYETHYKVTISDEVSMNEFTEKYEIIDQDGKIYIVRERN